MLNKDLLVKNFPDFSLCLVDLSNLTEFSNFVSDVIHKCYDIDKQTSFSEVEEVIKDDISHFDHAFFYAIRNHDNEIIGTVKVCEWNNGLEFPIHRHFGIGINDLTKVIPFKPRQIWHLGRLAVDNDRISNDPLLSRKRVSIFKILLIAAFRHICTYDDNIMIAECDSRLNEKVKLLGIHSKQIGKPLDYFGSVTIPIFNTGKALKAFINKYGHVWNV